MQLLAGASGYSFKEWKGSFYPEAMKPDGMLAFYAARLPTVEINNTFYRMPKAEVLEAWAKSTPAQIRFAIKASRRITHLARLKAESAGDSLAFLYRNLASLGEKRGPVLFQLPPFLKKDLPRLADFVRLLAHLACRIERTRIDVARLQADDCLTVELRQRIGPQPPLLVRRHGGYAIATQAEHR